MQILYLSRSLLPSKAANSVQVMKMCRALANKGHRVELVACRSSSASVESVFDYYGIKERFKITLLPGRTDRPAGLLFYLANFFAFIRNFKPPDIFYGRDLFTLTLATIFHNVPFFYEAHKPPSSPVHFFLTRLLLKKKALVKLVLITSSLRDYYIGKFPRLSRERVLVAADGADVPGPAAPGPADKGSSGRTVIGYVGHLYPGRGIEIILALAGELPQYDFLLVGGSEKDLSYWRSLSRDSANIRFTGYVKPGDLYRYYEQIDLALAPYQTSVSISGGGDTARWMSPLKIFEYMAYAKPIIASDLPVLKEVLQDRVNALLCAPDSVADWIKAINLLNEDRDLRRQIAANAFDDLINRYTWDKRVDRILADYQDKNY